MEGRMAGRQNGQVGRQRGSDAFMPFLLALPAFLAFLAAVLPSGLLRAQQPVFHSTSSELVVLPVVVTDKQGRYVSDLATQNFAVFDNGRRVPIELFSNEDTPVTIGLVIDASGSMRPKIGEVVAATMAFARASN